MAKRFWPGYRWRLLAHHRTGTGRKAGYTGARVELASDDFPLSHVEFDELVIDGWFHLEQMDERDWWLGIAGLNINIHVPADGRPSVLIELDDPERLGKLRNYAPASHPTTGDTRTESQ